MLGYEFTRWWTYRRIRDTKMVHYVWTVPLSLTTLSFLIYYILPVRPSITGVGGLLDRLSLAFTILPGFFISALAAVATFTRAEMDETMPDPAPTVLVHHQGRLVPIELTRRSFLSYLFSYLSIMSMFLFFMCGSVEFLDRNFDSVLGSVANETLRTGVNIIVKNIFIFFVLYLCSSVFVTMLHGIYFLCERIHMPNS
ncbi:hypothetical protein [Agrobacterium cavarae]|uniref:hypothetical protein n=1 Tax=Agrobacterium cavarae TaxID=2528239 RepID=UPI0028B0DB7E|nr:hypothetical protein [Agrobacterium cavarae]